MKSDQKQKDKQSGKKREKEEQPKNPKNPKNPKKFKKFKKKGKTTIPLKTGRLSFGICLALSAGFAALQGEWISYGVLFALIGALLFSGGYTLFVRSFVHSAPEITPATCNRLDVVSYTCTIRNRGIFPIPIVFLRGMIVPSEGESIPVRRQCSFWKRAVETIDIPFTPRRRGVYRFEQERLNLSDFFLLFFPPVGVAVSRETIVLPRVFGLDATERAGLFPHLSSSVKNFLGDEPSLEARPYVYGDNMRWIHWNLSARKQELIIRTPASNEDVHLRVYLDLSPHDKDPEEEEHLIESCLSVIAAALGEQIAVIFCYAVGRDIHTQEILPSSQALFEKIRLDLALCKFESVLPAEALVAFAGGDGLIFTLDE